MRAVLQTGVTLLAPTCWLPHSQTATAQQGCNSTPCAEHVHADRCKWRQQLTGGHRGSALHKLRSKRDMQPASLVQIRATGHRSSTPERHK